MIYSTKVTFIMVCLFLFAEGMVLFHAIGRNSNNTLLDFVEICTVIRIAHVLCTRITPVKVKTNRKRNTPFAIVLRVWSM